MESIGKREPVQRLSAAAEHLERYVGPYCGDVYDTAQRVFPDMSILRRTGVLINSKFKGMAFGFSDAGDPYVFIDHDDSIVGRGLRNRIIKRFDLPADLIKAPRSLFLPFVLAHELGHAVQHDGNFSTYFGEIDHTEYSPTVDYDAYVQSDKETNADYIAAVIVSRSRLGQEAGMLPPYQPAHQWREWAQARQLSLLDLQ